MTTGLFAADDTSSEWEVRSAEPSRRLPAWLFSLMLHMALLLILGFLPADEALQAPAESDRSVGIALVRTTPSETRYFSQDDPPTESAASDANNRAETDAAADASTQSDALPAALPSSSQQPVDLAFALPAAESVGADLFGKMPGADGLTLSNVPSGRVSGGQASTQVFGSQGTGSKFIYVFDRSASMLGFQARPLAAAKSELVASLEDLRGVHQFQILFYNNDVTVLNPDPARPPSLLFASDANKRLAREFVEGIRAAGATRHLEPLRLALAMQPDVVFFLTDAAEPQLTPSELADIRRRNRGSVINAIEFGAGPFRGGDNFLVQLARQNDGQHVYVDVTRLK